MGGDLIGIHNEFNGTGYFFYPTKPTKERNYNFAIKSGMTDTETGSHGWIQELEWAYKNFALTAGHYDTDPDGFKIHVFPIMAHIRFPLDRIKFGGGYGIALIQTPKGITARPRQVWSAEAIFDINEDWFFELRYLIGDLDIHREGGIIETGSRLNGYQFMMGVRF